MIDSGLLISESSNYANGLFLRPRPDSTGTGNHRVRVITDFRPLNLKTVGDHFPIPNIKWILQRLSGHKHFIVLDLKDSYQSIPIKKEDRHKASVITSFGQYTPTRLGYGFKNAPSHFSRMISRVISGLGGVLNYLDDIVVGGQTQQEALKNFEQVISRTPLVVIYKC